MYHNIFSELILKSVAALLVVCILSGCGGTQVVLTTGFDKDEIFVVGTESCRMPELMVYLTNIRNTYENIYGSEIRNVTSDGVTFDESIRNTALARLAQVKTMCLMASDRGIVLDDDELRLVNLAAGEYFSSLTEEEINALGVDEDLIVRMYSQMVLAQKAYDEIIRDISPEISDDEARFVKVRVIYMRTAYRNGDSLIPYMDRDYERIYSTLSDIRKGVLDGSLDFETESAKYNEAGDAVISFGKGMMDPAVEEAAFSLASDEVSDIIKASDGLYLMQCISPIDRSRTDANKAVITEKLRSEAFETVYNEYLAGLMRNLNTDLWKTVTCDQGSDIGTSSFFEIYEKYFNSEEVDG